ncbi:hypothetical protein G6M26_23345 [Agrobacterium tumefaciens]|nr:hypothetical protein [Agrobacterium tumefaciens]NTE21479.1 hypothetical protein [Agrobacterium tumefaciens]
MTLNEFEDLIIEDWTWRKTEISKLILIAEDQEEDVVLKSIILLLYSHWEGYIKKSSRVYLKFICNTNSKIGELSDNFKAVALKGVTKGIMFASETLTLQNELDYIKKFHKVETHTLSHYISIDLTNDRDASIINTNQNLNSKVLKNIIDVLGLNYKDVYETKKMYIGEHLLANRNAIGHGNRELASVNDFSLEINKIKKLREIIFSIVESLQEEMIEYCKESYFLKENQGNVAAFLAQKEAELLSAFNEIDTRYTDE